MSRPNSWLCSICTQVIQTSSGRIGRDATCTPPGQSLERFRKAAADDCFICAKVWNLSEQHRRAWDCLPRESWSPFYYIIDKEEYPKNTLHQIRVWVLYNDPTREQIEHATDVRFRLIPSIRSEYENLFVFSDIEESTGSSQTLDLAYSWFRECTSRHTRKCKAHPGQTEGWLPSRLIDIGSHGDTQWKLLITSTDAILSESLLYLTLSYRWGDDVQHELLTSFTMSQFRQGVEISSLPKTFQDTVIVARRLGIRYIWIDCLCIIQDSRDDWEAEAPEMRHIYANSACTIAASASDDADGGLFRSRDGRDIRPSLVTSTLASGHPETFYIFDKSYWDRHLLEGSLHRRGWVFQERFLGPRQLYFTQHQVLWECLEEHKCEGFPRGIPLHTSFKDTERLLKPFEERKQLDKIQKQGVDDHVMAFDALELWRDLVTAYSQCRFTRPEDKLYAFSGIAKLFQEVTGDRYLAGLWRSRVLHLLNWTVFTPKPRLSS